MYHAGPNRLFSPAIAYRDRTREKEIQLKARTFILTACVSFALVAPAAQAASTSNMLYRVKVQTVLFDKTHQLVSEGSTRKSKATAAAKTRSQVRQAAETVPAAPVSQPAQPGSGVPIMATTDDDYDNQQTLYGIPAPDAAPPVADSSSDTSSDTSMTSPLQDGYLLINQVN